MRHEDKPAHHGIRIAALALLALAGVMLIAALERSDASPGGGVALKAAVAGADGEGMDKLEHKVKRGPPGPPGPPGHEGPVGPRGPFGPDAEGVLVQGISINWQNGQYQGQDRQSFSAPGIGHGDVRCSPPTAAEPNGTQWVRFFPDESGTATSPPNNWNTTMWTLRSGGPPGTEDEVVVRTARLGGANQFDFYEGMNTSPTGIDLESTGTFTGVITTEPHSSGAASKRATSFRLSWHWNFTDPGSSRCYVAGSFFTGRGG